MKKIKAYGVCLYLKTKNSYKILLCKSIKSEHRWGFLKGVALNNETSKQTAIREFIEESSIKIEENMLEDYFYQENEFKDIGIYMVNGKNIQNLSEYFVNDILYDKYLSKENSCVKFFDIKNLPLIKKKQELIVNDILKRD